MLILYLGRYQQPQQSLTVQLFHCMIGAHVFLMLLIILYKSKLFLHLTLKQQNDYSSTLQGHDHFFIGHCRAMHRDS